MSVILIEKNWIRNFLRLGVDLYLNARLTQQRGGLTIKGCHRFWRKREGTFIVGSSKLQAVMDKVELDFKHASTVRDRRRRQASCVHEQSDIPEMVFQRRERQADFPNDLRPHVQPAVGGFPFFQRQGA